jgi:hypothetical protein
MKHDESGTWMQKRTAVQFSTVGTIMIITNAAAMKLQQQQ